MAKSYDNLNNLITSIVDRNDDAATIISYNIFQMFLDVQTDYGLKKITENQYRLYIQLFWDCCTEYPYAPLFKGTFSNEQLTAIKLAAHKIGIRVGEVDPKKFLYGTGI